MSKSSGIAPCTQRPTTARTPDAEGAFGKAWRIKVGADKPEKGAMVCGWLVYAPHAHPFWTCYCVSVCHLRDIPGVKPAVKITEESGHELLIVSIDPESCPNPDPDNPVFQILTPIDVCLQWGGLNDDQAHALGDLAIRLIVDGVLSPDQDFRRAWAVFVTSEVEKMVGTLVAS